MVSNELLFKFCPRCGIKQTYTRLSKLKTSLSNNTCCKRCNVIIIGKKRIKDNSYKEIPYSWFLDKQRQAKVKGREFEIDIKYIWRIYLKQNKLCALSGLPLDFSKETDLGMVSIDRIKNEKGYIKRNIQLLHKDVNFMKWTYEQDYFINLCKLISNYKK